MKRLTSLASIATIVLLAGCFGHAEDPTPGTPHSEASSTSPGADSNVEQSPPPAPVTPGSTASTSNIDANLQALRDLKVFEVRDVALNIPHNANCYNLPCPGHEKEFLSYDGARERAAEALADFTRKAVEAASIETADTDGSCIKTDDENLQSLKNLHVVVFGDAILETPQASNCYFVPRALKLTRIAHAFRKP